MPVSMVSKQQQDRIRYQRCPVCEFHDPECLCELYWHAYRSAPKDEWRACELHNHMMTEHRPLMFWLASFQSCPTCGQQLSQKFLEPDAENKWGLEHLSDCHLFHTHLMRLGPERRREHVQQFLALEALCPYAIKAPQWGTL